MGSRIRNSFRNMATGLLKTGLTMLLSFVDRSVIIYILGAEYLGLTSLFTSILTVLNMAELGFSTSVVFSMYKPIAQGDKDTVRALLYFIKKAYSIIGVIILILGSILAPFLGIFIKKDIPEDINIYILYFMYLGNTVVSYYFFAYKSTIFAAHQRSDISNNIISVTKILQYMAQLSIILVTKNYYLYVLICPIFTLLHNLLVCFFACKYFPDYVRPKGNLQGEMKESIKKQLGGLMISKLSNTARNSIDNIIISSMIGLIMVAKYNNYYLIYSALYSIILIVANSMKASVGDSIARESINKNYNDLMKFNFILMWIVGWMAICMLCLYQTFIELWVGEDMLLPQSCVIAFVVCFYAINTTDIHDNYCDGTGIWWKCKQIYIIETVLNILLNIVFCLAFGLFGVILATIFTLILCCFYLKSRILFREYFIGKRHSTYVKEHLLYFIVTVINGAICYFVIEQIQITGIFGLFAKGFACLLLPNILYFILYYRTKMFKETRQWASIVLRK